jgi:uncharacterized repeat protein (TIGR01451 family)
MKGDIMEESKFYPPSTFVESIATVTPNNGEPISVSTRLYILETSCLVLMQTVNSCKIPLGDNFTYVIYVLNKIEYDIYDIQLTDIIPNGASFVSTSVDNGDYEYYKGRVFYNIDVIRPGTFSKIMLTVCPGTFGNMINSIEVTSKDHIKYTVNNPSRVCCTVLSDAETNSVPYYNYFT